jgi:hypothetical protein
MPFKPNTAVILAEVALRKNLQAMEKHLKEAKYSLFELTPLKRQAADSNVLDESGELVVDFYSYVIQLIQKSHELKTPGVKELSLKGSAILNELGRLQTQIISHLMLLEKIQPDVLAYILNSTAGRQALYYLILNTIIHKDEWDLAALLSHWCNALIDTRVEEHDVLQYLVFRLRVSTITKDASKATVFITDEIKNPFIIARCELSKSIGDETAESKIEQLNKLLASPLVFSAGIPYFIIQFIQIEYAYLALTEMSAFFENIPLLLRYTNQLSDAHYLPEIPPQMKDEIPHHVLSQTYRLCSYVYLFKGQYSLYVDPSSLLNSWHVILMFKHIDLFDVLDDCALSPEESVHLATCALNLIKKQRVFKPEHDHYFWNTIIAILSLDGLNDLEYMHFFAKSFAECIDLTMHSLFNLTFEREAIRVLDCFLKYDLTKTITPAHFNFYTDLRSALIFIAGLPLGKINADNRGALNLLLDNMQEGKYHFAHLKKTVFTPELRDFRAMLKDKLLQRAPFLKEQLDTLLHSLAETALYNQFYELIIQLATLLKANETELNQLVDNLRSNPHEDKHYLSLFAEGEKAGLAKQPAAKKLTKPKKYQSHTPQAWSPPSSSSIFQPQPHIIKRDRIPSSLIRLADEIRQLAKQELIIKGGAVAGLYLGNDNPNDYDCIVLDVDQATLLTALKEAGFNAQLIGKKHPVIKLELVEGQRKIDVDISTDISEGKTLTKAMEAILARCDFKISALYMVLSYNAAEFEVKGYSHSLHSINNKKISTVNHRKTIFEEDAIRLFRLIKIILQYPDFTLDNNLNLILRTTDFNQLFNLFINDESGEIKTINPGRIGTALDSLFSRFGLMTVIKQMGELGIFEGMTGVPYDLVKPSLDLLSSYLKEGADAYVTRLAFYQFVYIHYCLAQKENKDLKDWPFLKVSRAVRPSDRGYFKLIEHTILQTPMNLFVVAPELINMINDIKKLYSEVLPEQSMSAQPPELVENIHPRSDLAP